MSSKIVILPENKCLTCGKYQRQQAWPEFFTGSWNYCHCPHWWFKKNSLGTFAQKETKMANRYQITARQLLRPESKEGEGDGIIGTTTFFLSADSFDDVKVGADEVVGENGELTEILELPDEPAE